jgi:3',5'-cyclic AMP phosphodiesterase CpdA
VAGALAAPWLVDRWSSRTDCQETDQRFPFFFIVAADPQLFWGPVKLWETAVAHANRLKPSFMVVCGDLVQEPGSDEQAQAYLQVAAKLDKSIPLVNVAGNHDVGAPPTPESLAWFEKHFGKPWRSFTHAGCLCIVLESDVLSKPEKAPKIAEQQMAWLRKTLQDAGPKKPAHIMVFEHHSLCLQRVDEPDGYFNLPRPLRQELLELFHKHGVRAVFSGHYHRNAYVKDGELELITTSSLGKPLGKDPTGFRIVKVFADRIEHRYYGYDQMPQQVDFSPAIVQNECDSGPAAVGSQQPVGRVGP